MSDVLAPQKTGRGWIMEIPAEMAQVLGVDEGSIIVLYPHEGGMSYEILPPPSPKLKASVRETYEQFKDAFEEMKRLGD
ncbi:MAG: AbrB/MazE/SpoVT family DNA-binding domain-containing protein [Rubrivivax sp.]|nr:AbrB/MazE/SpoVT family DNA-binding domain-containing protein [Pyrinomonadaceae bacterium]